MPIIVKNKRLTLYQSYLYKLVKRKGLATFSLNEKSIQISLYSMLGISLPITFKNESFS